MNDSLLSYADAGVILNCSERTVWQLVKDEKLQKIKIGTKVSISFNEVQSYIETLKQESQNNGNTIQNIR